MKAGREKTGRFSVIVAATAALCLAIGFSAGWRARSHFSSPSRKAAEPSRIDAYFPPRGGAQDAIIENIDQARREALAALYYFTEPALSDARIQAREQGIRIEVIFLVIDGETVVTGDQHRTKLRQCGKHARSSA